MFTGIILERGLLLADPQPSPQGGVRLRLSHSPDLDRRLAIGASLAVAGVCLTVVERAAGEVTVELSPETLARTTLGTLRAGAAVNLEPPLRMGDALGGHWVQGHVDATALVRERRDLAAHRVLQVATPPALGTFIVEKGSIAVDGVSLTVASLTGEHFEVALIPHTLAMTTLGGLRPGDRVNLEVDVLAKYVQRSLAERGLVAPGPPA